MNIILTGKNIDVTESLKNQVEKKVKKLERYFRPETVAHVTVSMEKNRKIIEVTIPIDGVVIRAEEDTQDMFASVDLVLDKLERQIHKHKTKLEKRFKHGAFRHDRPLFREEFDYEEDDEPQIVRTKRFPIKPMSIDEAMMQMDLLGHAFFVFSNSDTEQTNVLYRRKDGHYGLIEPDYM